jgi:hypothetical protein
MSSGHSADLHELPDVLNTEELDLSCGHTTTTTMVVQPVLRAHEQTPSAPPMQSTDAAATHYTWKSCQRTPQLALSRIVRYTEHGIWISKGFLL